MLRVPFNINLVPSSEETSFLTNFYGLYNLSASSRIWTWDLSICLYLNLKHGDFDRLATMVGKCRYYCHNNFEWIPQKMILHYLDANASKMDLSPKLIKNPDFLTTSYLNLFAYQWFIARSERMLCTCPMLPKN